MTLYVRSPHGLLHAVKKREWSGYLRTFCGRIVELGWSQRPRGLRNSADPHVCRVCEEVIAETNSS